MAFSDFIADAFARLTAAINAVDIKASSPSGAGLSGIATVTVPAGTSAGQLEWSENIVATEVKASHRILLSLAATTDDDENDPELLDIASMQGIAAAGAITIKLAFLTPTSGPIKLNWSVK